MTTSTLLTQLETDVRGIVRSIESDMLHLSLERLNHKQTQLTWSALQCFDHLNRYNTYYLAALESALTKAAAKPSNVVNYSWVGRKSIDMMQPGNPKKQKTFKKMQPASSALQTSVIEQFLVDQERLLELLKKASAKDSNCKLIPVEFFKLLKMTIAETLQFVIVHEQRHLQQAMRAVKF